MKLNKHRSLRIINPTSEWHSALLNTCQSIVLKIRHPHFFLMNCSRDAYFDVELSPVAKDFLIIERVDTSEHGDKVYYINQKFNMSRWATYGEVFLGNIVVELKNNKDKDAKKFKSTICVNHVCSDKRSNILTCVNPVGDAVKMQPHQRLEVVVFESSWNDWQVGRIEPSGSKDIWAWEEVVGCKNGKGIDIKQLNYSIVGDRSEMTDSVEQSYPVLNRYNFTVNPRLSAKVKEDIEKHLKFIKKPLREHHYWFGFTDETAKRLMGWKNDTYDVSFMEFRGNCHVDEENMQVWRGIDLKLVVRGKKKQKMRPYSVDPNSVEHKFEVTKRIKDEVKSVLTNPLPAEQIDFVYGGSKNSTIEMVAPCALWSDLGEDVRWEAKIDDDHPVSHTKISSKIEYSRWGQVFQRFEIVHNYNANVSEARFIGAIILACLPKCDHNGARRRIAFWLLPKNAKNVSKSMNVPDSSLSMQTTRSYPSNMPRKHYKIPQLCEVDFVEISSDTLAGKAKVIKYSDIWGHTNTSTSCNSSFYEDAKKKQTNGCGRQLHFASLPSETGESRRGDRQENSSTLCGVDTSTNTGTSTISSHSWDDRVSSHIVHNPGDKERLTVAYNQDLIIKMSLPVRLVGNKCEDELWTVVRDPNAAFQVFYSKLEKAGETYIQQIRIRPRQVQPIVGNQMLGSITFECSQQKRTVFIDCQTDSIKDIKMFNGVNLMTPTTKHESQQGGVRLFIKNWEHNNGIVIDCGDSLFMRNPFFSSCWEQDTWNMTIEQQTLPRNIWQNPILADVLDSIDVYNPWFPSPYPLQMNSTYMFRPLERQQPHIRLILKALAQELTEDTFTFAKITFNNSRHPNNCNVDTPYGVLTSEFRLSRSFYLCVNLNAYRDIIVGDLDCKTQIEISPNQVLDIKLMPSFVTDAKSGKTVEYPWYMSYCPKFLTPGRSMKDNHRFHTVGKPSKSDVDWIRFVAAGLEKAVLVKYGEEECA